jgi:CheY-like chemotaxis protein
MKSSLLAQAASIPAEDVQRTSSDRSAPASPGIVPEPSTQEFADCVPEKFEDWLRSAERQQPKVSGSSNGRRGLPDPGSKGRASIVLVDDDELLLMALKELLEDNKYTTKSFTKSEDALEYFKGHKPDLVLCDVNPQHSAFGGFTLFERMAKLGHMHNVPFMFMSGLLDEAIIRAGKELGADDYLTKPFEPDMLLSVAKGKLRKYKLSEKNH